MISVVILNFNGKKFLNKCLDSVFKTCYANFEVIVVDNASTDGSIELAQMNFRRQSNLRIISNDTNLGFAEGNNIGAKAAAGEYVLFLNNDTEVDPNWLVELVAVIESDKSIGAAQSKILLFDHKTIDSAGDFVNRYGKGWMRGRDDKDKGQYNKTHEIFSPRGAAAIVKRQILREVGYFDPTFFTICEDIDLGWRIRLNGYKVVYVPQSVVYHFGSGTRKKVQDSEKSYYYNSRNSLIMLIKNYDTKNLLMSGITNVSVELAMFLISLFFPSKRKYNLSRARAFTWVLVNFRHVWEKRLQVQHWVRKVPDDTIRKLMIRGNSPFLSIVWNLLYKDRVDFSRFLNENVIFKNGWLL
jgi:GT2 family glycosyltransferase